MRARIVLPVLACGLLLAIAAWLLRPGRGAPSAPGQPPALALNSPAGGVNRPAPGTFTPGRAPVPPAPTPSLIGSNAPGMDSPEARQAAYVQERISQLMDLAMDDQPASLEVILGELNNREPEIRQAAVQAALQFGSREAIPRLKAAADQTDDIREKAAINEAIEFLEIPSPAEAAAARANAAAPAAGQPPAPTP